MIKKCKQCGAEFEATRRDRQYCSKQCKSKWQYEHNTEERPCVVCGKLFTVYKHKNTYTCSYTCGAIFREQFNSRKMKCAYCGREYEGHDKGRNRFCCIRCRELWKIKQRADNPEQTAAENARQRAARQNPPQECPQCGKPFIPKMKGTIYCSAICYRKAAWQAKKKTPEPRQCVCCGESFIPKRRNQKYCSLKCQKKVLHRREYERRKGKEDNNINSACEEPRGEMHSG